MTRTNDDTEVDIVDLRSRLERVEELLETRHADVPPRPENVALESVVQRAVERAIAPRLDSMMPMQVRQTEILEDSAEERQRRAAREERERDWRKMMLTALAIVLVLLEMYRTAIAQSVAH